MFLKIVQNKIIISMVVITIIMLGSLSIYLPKVTEKNTMDIVIKNSKTMVEQIKLTREYYVSEVVADVKAYAPNIKFDYDHFGVDGKLAFPTSLIHELSDIYTKNSGLKIQLYSKYPFKPKENRTLTPVQEEALDFVEQDDEGVWIKRDTIDGKEVLRVAVADFMTQQACVNCHNSHADKTWEEGKWKLGDKRGVLEVITPLSESITANNLMKNKILFFIFISMVVLVLFYSYSLVRRETELEDINKDLEDIVEEQTKEIKKNLEIMGKYIIYSRTDTKGFITEASDAFCNISQYAKEELLGQNHNIIRHPDMPKAVFKQMWETIKSHNIWQGEVKNRKKDGSYYWVIATITPEIDNDGRLTGYLAIRQDITSQKDLDENNKKLFESEKLASLGEMIGNIAHQWRQPLSVISTGATGIMLQKEMEMLSDDELENTCKSINDNAQYLSRTIDDFSDFIRGDRKLVVFRLKDTIESFVNLIHPAFTRDNIDLIINQDETITLEGYPNELIQCLMNIFNNAKDALKESDPEEKYVFVDIFKKEKNIVIQFRDNAGGIPNDVISRIFEPYFTTKHKSQGTGLGLHMTYNLIKDGMNGTIRAKNVDYTYKGEVYTGAEFTIVLPQN